MHLGEVWYQINILSTLDEEVKKKGWFESRVMFGKTVSAHWFLEVHNKLYVEILQFKAVKWYYSY